MVTKKKKKIEHIYTSSLLNMFYIYVISCVYTLNLPYIFVKLLINQTYFHNFFLLISFFLRYRQIPGLRWKKKKKYVTIQCTNVYSLFFYILFHINLAWPPFFHSLSYISWYFILQNVINNSKTKKGIEIKRKKKLNKIKIINRSLP